MTTTNNVEEVSTMNITVGEVSGASLVTRVVANHNASDPDQHTISAITDLEGRLSALEALETEREEGNTIKTIYSKGENFANRYKFIIVPSDGYPRIGRFVSFNETTEEVDVCTGQDIFGVTVDDAGFIGNYSADQFDEDYVAVVTSGVVDVICAIDVQKGDCVVSDEYGRAKKAIDGCGYRVIDVNDEGEYKLATIMLAVQADKINRIARNIEVLTGRTNANETNILTAINLASLACAKNGVDTDYLKELEDEVRDTISSSASNSLSALEIANQAQIAAASALTNANNMKNDAVAEATNAAIDTILASKEFEEATKEGVSELEDKVTIVEKKVNGSYETVDTINGVAKEETIVYYAEDTKKYHYYDYDNSDWAETTDPRAVGLNVAIAGIQVETDANSSNISQLTGWQGTTENNLARIEQKADENGAYIKSTVVNIDRYSVGPHSQAYGLTLEQASIILEEDMIYVPIEDRIGENAERYKRVGQATADTGESNRDKTKVYYTETKVDEETVKTYYYWGSSEGTDEYGWIETGTFPIYDGREFSRGNLYKWGTLQSGLCGWITVDRNYSEEKLNTSAPAVEFSHQEMDMYKDDNSINYGYWYTETTSANQNILDKNGNITSEYEPHTLYKWESYQNGDETKYHWVAVATLAGNSQSRAVSQIAQDADGIKASVTDINGNVAVLQATVDDHSSKITSFTAWDNRLTTVEQKSDSNSSSISQVAAKIGGCEEWDGEEDRDTSKKYYLETDSGRVFYYYKDDEWKETADPFVAGVVIDAASIVTAVTGDESSIALLADNIVLDASQIMINGETTFTTTDDNGVTKINGGHIDGSSLRVAYADVTGHLEATTGKIGGFDITDDHIVKNGMGLNSNDDNYAKSLLSAGSELQVAKTMVSNTDENGVCDVVDHVFTLDDVGTDYVIIEIVSISSISNLQSTVIVNNYSFSGNKISFNASTGRNVVEPLTTSITFKYMATSDVSPIRFFAGAQPTRRRVTCVWPNCVTNEAGYYEASGTLSLPDVGMKYTDAVVINVFTDKAGNSGASKTLTIDGNTFSLSLINYGANNSIQVSAIIEYMPTGDIGVSANSNFLVLDDGSAYAKAISIEGNSNIGGIYVDAKNGLFNNSTFTDSQCGILSNSSYIGYGNLTVGSNGLLSPSGWSPIYLFGGQNGDGLQDGFGKEDISVQTNTDNCNFYVTQSGFVNAKSLLCDGGVIGIKSDGYDIAMNAGQFIVRGMNDTYNVKNCKTIYALQGITWNDANNNITGRIVANYDTKFMDVSGTWKFSDLEVGSSVSSGNVLLTKSEAHVQTNSNIYIDDSSSLHITVAHDDGETTYNVGAALKVSIDKINEIIDKINEILEDEDFSADKLEQIQ